jgi:hypothetical protein
VIVPGPRRVSPGLHVAEREHSSGRHRGRGGRLHGGGDGRRTLLTLALLADPPRGQLPHRHGKYYGRNDVRYISYSNCNLITLIK